MSTDSSQPELGERIGILQTLANLINVSELEASEIGLTLSIHGTIVSGLMISRKRYYEETGKQFVDAIKSPIPENESIFKKEFKMLFDQIKEPKPNDQVEGEQQSNYIFMREARIFNGAQVIPSNGTTYWITKIKSVDGFCLGPAQGKT
jgi:hypothetical protein